MIKTRKKFFVIIAAFCMVLSVSIFGVFALTTGSKNATFSASFEAPIGITGSITLSGTNAGVEITPQTQQILVSTPSLQNITIGSQTFSGSGNFYSIIFDFLFYNSSVDVAYTTSLAALPAISNVTITYFYEQGTSSSITPSTTYTPGTALTVSKTSGSTFYTKMRVKFVLNVASAGVSASPNMAFTIAAI